MSLLSLPLFLCASLKLPIRQTTVVIISLLMHVMAEQSPAPDWLWERMIILISYRDIRSRRKGTLYRPVNLDLTNLEHTFCLSLSVILWLHSSTFCEILEMLNLNLCQTSGIGHHYLRITFSLPVQHCLARQIPPRRHLRQRPLL